MLNLYRLRKARTDGMSDDGVANESQQLEMLVLAEANSDEVLQAVGSEGAYGFELPDTTGVEFVELADCTNSVYGPIMRI